MTERIPVRELKPGYLTSSITGSPTYVVDVYGAHNPWGDPINYTIVYRREDDENTHSIVVRGAEMVEVES